MPLLPSLPNASTWRMLMAFGLATVVLGLAQGYTVHPRSIMVGLTIIGVMLLVSHIYTYWRPRPQFAIPTVLLAYFVATALVFGPMSYFMAGLDRPLVDATLAAIDPWLGFDWRAVHRYVAEHPMLATPARIAYSTSGMQIFLVWIILGLTGQLERLSVFLTAFVISAGAVIVLAGLFPAIGGYVYFGITPAELGAIGDGPGRSYLEDFNGLRDGSLRAIDLSKLDGICQFPSFHTVVALMCAWAVAGTRWIAVPAALYSAFVVFTVMPIGGHHLADVIAGAALTWAALALAWRIEARERDARLAGSLAAVPAADEAAA